VPDADKGKNEPQRHRGHRDNTHREKIRDTGSMRIRLVPFALLCVSSSVISVPLWFVPFFNP
jgi:hypothetical protein